MKADPAWKILQLTGILFLLVCMIIHSGGFFLLFKANQYSIRKEIKHKIKAGVPDDELIHIKIPKSWETSSHPDFQRIHEGEFRYKGMMYDIVGKDEQQDTTLYSCVSDKQETLLFANLDEQVKAAFGMDGKRNQQNQNILRILSGSYTVADAVIILNPSEKITHATPPETSLTGTLPAPSTPPPRS